MAKSTNRRRGRQLSLALLRGRGGPGRGQGRKKRRFDYVPHRVRAYLDPNHPVHVSMSIVVGLPSLRGAKLWAAVRRGFVHGCLYGEGRERKEQPATSSAPRGNGGDRAAAGMDEHGGSRGASDRGTHTHPLPTTARIGGDRSRRARFRIVEFSVQGRHIHLICEARDRSALSRGIQGFKVRVARAINKRLGRTGTVFADRYHARDITNPTQCRHALAYVLGNQRHHAYAEQASYPRGTIDPCSSAAVFAGWTVRRPRTWAHAPPTDCDDQPMVAEPRTWLLRGGWKRGGGLISPSAVPGLPVGAPPLPVW